VDRGLDSDILVEIAAWESAEGHMQEVAATGAAVCRVLIDHLPLARSRPHYYSDGLAG
jgi:hypothetical protein